jgi:hypothetical protein
MRQAEPSIWCAYADVRSGSRILNNTISVLRFSIESAQPTHLVKTQHLHRTKKISILGRSLFNDSLLDRMQGFSIYIRGCCRQTGI